MYSEGFTGLGASRAVADALAKSGITTPFPVQDLVVPDALEGRDVLVKSPTGSGKTLAFAIPIVERLEPGDPRPSALVLAPTRELAAQILEEMRPLAAARGLSVAAVYGGAGIERQSKLARRAHILVATPGRLEDLIARGAISLGQVRILVLDEADRMLDMGFRRRSTASSRSIRASARRSSSRRRSTATSARSPRVHAQRRAATSTRRRASGAATCTTASSPVTRDAKFDALVASCTTRARA